MAQQKKTPAKAKKAPSTGKTAASAQKKAPSRAKKAASAKKKVPATAPDPARVAAILAILERLYPEPTTALDWETPLQLLVATILSAQCTDERVNKVTPELFAAFPTAEALGNAPLEELERLVHSTGFFRNKAKAIQGVGRALAAEHGGEVPAEMEALVALPGVARKTANVVLGSAFGVASGVVVDTHVKRLAGRLGLSAEKDPNKIERDLMAAVPEETWIELGHWLILHGRAVCPARKPRCAQCELAPHCPSADLS